MSIEIVDIKEIILSIIREYVELNNFDEKATKITSFELRSHETGINYGLPQMIISPRQLTEEFQMKQEWVRQWNVEILLNGIKIFMNTITYHLDELESYNGNESLLEIEKNALLKTLTSMALCGLDSQFQFQKQRRDLK